MLVTEGRQVGSCFWICIDKLVQPGREQLALKPRIVTESYFYLPTGKFQHTIQATDWDVVVPEAVWIGSWEQAQEVVELLRRIVPFECRILPVPSCCVGKQSGIVELNGKGKLDFVRMLMVTAARKTRDGHSAGSMRNSVDSNLKGAPLGKFLLDAEFMRRALAKPNLKDTYINIYYKRRPDDPPLMDNVLYYEACLVRFHPRMPENWRYMCQLSTYVEAFRKRCRHICEECWNTPWSDDRIEDFLGDEFLFRQVSIDVISEIIFESELCGNELGRLLR